MNVKRLLSFTLALSLLSTNVSYASSPSTSTVEGVSTTPRSHPNGGRHDPNANGVYNVPGVRVTFADATDFATAGIEPLNSGYTIQDLKTKREELNSVPQSRYMLPGSFGIYYSFEHNGGANLLNHVKYKSATLTQHGSRYGSVRKFANHFNATAFDNKLGLLALKDSGTSIPFNEDIHNAIYSTEFSSVDDWLHFIEQTAANAGYPLNATSVIDKLMSNGDEINQNLRNFSMDEADLDEGHTPEFYVRRSFTGYLTTLIYFTVAAREMNDPQTYNAFKQDLWAWKTSGYDPTKMPLLYLEPTHLTTLTHGNETSVPDYIEPLSSALAYAYGEDVLSAMHDKWEDSEYGNFEAMFARVMQNRPLVGRTGAVWEFFDYHYDNGRKIPRNYHGNPGRNYAGKFNPVKGSSTKGYALHYTYWARVTPTTSGEGPRGSFTWDLDPKGVIDVSPDVAIDANSTIYKWNISQNGNNANNWNDWSNWIKEDNKDKNRIKLSIYRKEDKLAVGSVAPEYSREQVKSVGVLYPAQGEYFKSASATVSGVPVLGTLELNQEREVTDSQLLEILRSGTGLSISEPVNGDIENKHVKATYAVYVEIGRGDEPLFHLSNNQAEYVHYKSKAGIYSWSSDAPTGYSEVKAGEFNDSTYKEPFEAMAGTPTTENLYFASGGQEFVAQITYEYVKDKETTRHYEQKYSNEVSAGHYYTKQTSDWMSPAQASSWDWNTRVEGINQKTETWDNGGSFVHYNSKSGSGGNKVDYATSHPLHDGTSFTSGDGLWEVISYEQKGTGKEPDIDQDGDGVKETKGETKDWTDDPGDLEDVEVTDVRITRVASLTDHNTGARDSSSEEASKRATSIRSSIKFDHKYTNFNYAKILDAHVWRLEKSSITGMQKLIQDGTTDRLEAEVMDKSNALFNVAENDTAADGRVWYTLHPDHKDNFVFNKELKTRGSAVSHNYLAAIDLINSQENPNNLYDDPWIISDHLILEMTEQTTSLLYHEYNSRNSNERFNPIARMSVASDPLSNGYNVVREDGSSELRTYSNKGVPWTSPVTSFNVSVNANATNGTEDKICKNKETYVGARLRSKHLGWGGYNGQFDETSTTYPYPPGKYEGKRMKASNFNYSNKKIFQNGYSHHNNGERGGFSTSSPHVSQKPSSPMVLVVNGIDTHDMKVPNGIKSFGPTKIFYNSIISWGDGAEFSQGENEEFKMNGFTKMTEYTDGYGKVNDIVIHNPVSAQFASLISPPDHLDQRVNHDNLAARLNADNNLNRPSYHEQIAGSHLECKYTGPLYYTLGDYAQVRGDGLSNMSVTGNVISSTVPITVPGVSSTGSQEYGFTDQIETFTAPVKGTYHIIAEGSEGSDALNKEGSGGNGAKVEGDVELEAGQTIYFYVAPSGKRNGLYKTTGVYSSSGNRISNTNTPHGLKSGGATIVSLTEKGADIGLYTGPRSALTESMKLLYKTYPVGYSFPPQSITGDTVQVYVIGGGTMTAKANRGMSSYLRLSYPISAVDLTVEKLNNQYYLVGTEGSGNKVVLHTDFSSYPGNATEILYVDFPRSLQNGIFRSDFKKDLYNPRSSFIIAAGGGAASSNSGGRSDVPRLYGKNAQTSSALTSAGIIFGRTHNINDEPASRAIIGSGGGGMQGGSSAEYSVNSGALNAKARPTSGGNGGISWYDANTLRNVREAAGSREGDGRVQISWNVQTTETKYIPKIEGTYTYNTSDGEVFGFKSKPQVFTAPSTGVYSVHLYGSASSTGMANGGYAAGQLTLRKDERVLVTPGGMGSNAKDVQAIRSAGYNGGGLGSEAGAGTFGGGGATDIAKVFTQQDINQIHSNSVGASINGNKVTYSSAGSTYSGPGISVASNNVYRIDIIGEGFENAKVEVSNQNFLSVRKQDEYIQVFVRPANNDSNFKVDVKYDGKPFSITEVFAINMADRIAVAAGGGSKGTTGAGGAGGSGDGSTGYLPGVGESSSTGGAGGAGWYGGKAGAQVNTGGAGGSSYTGVMTKQTMTVGQNNSAGYAVFVYPGKGTVPGRYILSGSDPHKAPNLNWQMYTSGWKHQNGHECQGVNCPFCAAGIPLYSPSGFVWDTAVGSTAANSIRNNSYVYVKNKRMGLTHGNDLFLDDVGYQIDAFDTYTLDLQNYLPSVWKSTEVDAPAYDTRTSVNPLHHYAKGDPTCWKVPPKKPDPNLVKAPFVILDYDFEVYFPNKGDFLGNNAFAIEDVQHPEGWGYTNGMDTTIWLKDKYLVLPMDVTYNGKTYLRGNKIPLGKFDGEKFIDDSTDGSYKYKFHVLLNNDEAAAAEVQFFAVAKNSPVSGFENTTENRNYTRYGDSVRSYHDARKQFYIDVVGRIGVMSILDTGDFRFSNYYKQPIPGQWKVNGIVSDVDPTKQNFVSVDKRTIFGDDVSEHTKGQNTWGTLPWIEPIDKLRPFPLRPGENNLASLKNQAHRLGYPDYMSLVTTGNYYGENSRATQGKYRVEIHPYYYFYNIKTRQFTPVDVYIKDNNQYKSVNKFGAITTTADYKFRYDLNWVTESNRRLYSGNEETISNLVKDNFFYDPSSSGDDGSFVKIQLPTGLSWPSGNAQYIALTDRNRTFIGSRNRYGINQEPENKVPDLSFNRQAQRWHYTLGLPSSAVFVKAGDQVTPSNISNLKIEDGVILCALEAYSKGTVWTLKYTATPTNEQMFYLYADNTTLVDWRTSGVAGPQTRKVVVVYDGSTSSRGDLDTRGTH